MVEFKGGKLFLRVSKKFWKLLSWADRRWIKVTAYRFFKTGARRFRDVHKVKRS